MASKNTIYFEKNSGKYIQTFRTTPEYIHIFVKQMKNAESLKLAICSADLVDIRKKMQAVSDLEKRIRKEKIPCEFVCHGKLQISKMKFT